MGVDQSVLLPANEQQGIERLVQSMTRCSFLLLEPLPTGQGNGNREDRLQGPRQTKKLQCHRVKTTLHARGLLIITDAHRHGAGAWKLKAPLAHADHTITEYVADR
jgi:hypothetical protein